MSTKLNSTLMILPILVSLLSGCQSGGGDDTAATQNPQTDDRNQDVAEEVKMADIEADETLKFVSHREMTLVLDLSDQTESQAYLSVYSNYKADSNAAGGGWVIDYGSRILGSSLTTKNVERKLVIPQHHEKLLVQVWYYDASKPPLTWEVPVGGRVAL